MKKLFRATTILMSLLTIGCRATTQPIQPTPLTVTGPFTHKGTGMEFPQTLGSFTRGNIIKYDSSGQNISIGYNQENVAEPIAVTVYVFPAPRLVSIGSPPKVIAIAREHLFANYYERSKQEILRVHAQAKLLADEDFKLSQADKTIYGKKASFQYEEVFAGRRQLIASYLFLFQVGKWMVKYRVTYPSSIEKQAAPKVQSLMEKLKITVSS